MERIKNKTITEKIAGNKKYINCIFFVKEQAELSNTNCFNCSFRSPLKIQQLSNCTFEKCNFITLSVKEAKTNSFIDGEPEWVPWGLEYKGQKTFECGGITNKVKYYTSEQLAGIVFVKIPGGVLQKRSDTGCHEINLPPFLMSQMLITETQWHSIMENQNSTKEQDAGKVKNNLCWTDCMKFIQDVRAKTGVNMTLPSVTQWEYACRAGTDHKYYWGESMDDNFCWHKENTSGEPMPVGRKAPNAFGLYDMAGNLWEQCADANWPCVTQLPKDGKPYTCAELVGSTQLKALKGGSYDDSPAYCEWVRYYHIPHNAPNPIVGFRPIISL